MSDKICAKRAGWVRDGQGKTIMMMSRFTQFPQEVFSQFNQLDKALIDASSIIYANKADFLKMLSATLKLFSIREILSEVGSVSDSIKPLTHTENSLSNDQKLIACALHFGLPVISEDKKILMAMKSARRPYFNSLMMLNFLLYRQTIDDRQYDRYHLALKQFARYSDEIWKYGAKIHAAIEVDLTAFKS